jgi:DNA-binding CsgD family transcriptional regulator
MTKKEKEVLELIKKKYTNKEIALILNVSENTVETHVRNILSKKRVGNRKKLTIN